MLVARVDTGPGKVIKLLKFRVSDSGLGVGRGEGKGDPIPPEGMLYT